MIPATSVIPSGYSWSALPRSRIHEVRFNGQLVGTVQHPSISSSDYEAKTTASKWIFRRKGFLGTGAEILDGTSSEPMARLKGRILTFSDGQTFRLRSKGLWHPTWTVQSQSGGEVLRLHTCERTAEVFRGGTLKPERRNLLILFVLYRVFEAEDDLASAAMVAS